MGLETTACCLAKLFIVTLLGPSNLQHAPMHPSHTHTHKLENRRFAKHTHTWKLTFHKTYLPLLCVMLFWRLYSTLFIKACWLHPSMPTPTEVMLCSSKTAVVHRRPASHSDTMGQMEGLHQGAHLYLIPLSWITPISPQSLMPVLLGKFKLSKGPSHRGYPSTHCWLSLSSGTAPKNSTTCSQNRC